MLAIDTATDACSVALVLEGNVRQIHERIPRQHSQRLMGMLEELYPGGDLRKAEVEAIVYGEGPGSFTGLRIAASAAQGLAFAADIPALGVSTLACQALTAHRHGLLPDGCVALSLIDARINQTYFALYEFVDGLPQCRLRAGVSAPEAIPVAEICEAAGGASLVAVGNGAAFAERFPQSLSLDTNAALIDLVPEAMDLLPLAQRKFERGERQRPEQVAPSYVQETIGWKKLSEQGKQS